MTEHHEPRLANHRTEGALIGNVLLEPVQLDSLAARIHPEVFHHPSHALVWKLLLERSRNGDPIDLNLLIGDLKRIGRRNTVGVEFIQNLTDLVLCGGSLRSSEAYATELLELYQARRLASASQTVTELAKGDAPVDQFVARATDELTRAMTRRSSGRLYTMVDLAIEFDAYREDRIANKGKLPGVTTGLADLDDATGGLKPKEMTILAARPAMGKSALMLSVAKAAACGTDDCGPVHVLIFSLEMPRLSLMRRLACSEAGVNPRCVERGTLTEQDNSKVVEATHKLGGLPITVIDEANLTVADMRAKALQANAIRPVGLIIIDHLMLFNLEAPPGKDSYPLIGDAARQCRVVCKSMGVPMLLLHQLNRECEFRGGNRPLLSDLGKSGDIEAHADNAWMLHREEYYKRDTKSKGIAEVILAKQREGEMGSIVRVAYEPQFQRFGNLERTRNVNGFSDPEWEPGYAD